MLPLNLEGDTLGQRHFNLNKVTNEAFKNNVAFDEIINLKEESPVDRLFKIDLASKQRNVDYIIENIKSTDSLYFSRALHSTWLFSNNEYAHIVNPQYLHETLFHQMTNKAIGKFLLQLRLNLKDKKRCEDFYTYYWVTGNEDAAKKYLPKCTEDFILLQLQANRHQIDKHMFKLLCETSLEVINVVLPKLNVYSQWNYMKAINFIASTETDTYIDVLGKYFNNYYACSTLSKRTTNAILMKCKSKVLSDTKFCEFLDLSTLGKHLSQTELKQLLIELSADPERQSWFSINKVSPLLKYLKRDEKFDFVKSLFERRHTNKSEVRYKSVFMCYSSSRKVRSVSASNVYECYRFAEFKTAFPELKKLIRTESSADERLAMLKVIVTACRNSQSNILTLLQYFHDRHINEPRNFKMKFLRNFLNNTNAVRCDDKCWSVLNEVFHNCEVYEESCDDAQICVDSIVARHMIRGTSVPDLLLDKFYKNFSSLKFLVKKLDEDSRNKIFNGICTRLFDSVKELRFQNEDDLKESIELAGKLLDFIKVWKRSLADFPIIVELVKKIIVQSDIVNLEDKVIDFNREKKWRRIFFNETLLYDRSESAYINILKHEAMVLPEHHIQLDKLIKSDNLKYKKFFSKLRLYFYNDLALNYRSLFEKKLEACHKETIGTKSVVFTICILTEKDRFNSLIQKYIPHEYKVVWSTEDPCILSLRKNFARYMHLVQPTVDIENVLAFTKGDYLQFAISSLLSICKRITTEECKTLIPKLLEGAISVQKLGIRLAFLNLSIDEVTKLCVELWGQTSNASIRALIFKLIFELLCKEKKEKKILELWELLKVFIGKLSSEEDRSIYPILAQVEQVPASIRPQFCMISYDRLKSVPEKFNCNGLVSHVTDEIVKLCKDIDEEFVMKIIMEFIQDCFVSKGLVKNTHFYFNSSAKHLISNYLLFCDNLEMQKVHFEKVAKPLISHYKSMWNETKDDEFVTQEHLTNFLELFINKSRELAIDRQSNYVTPKLIFNMMLAEIETFAPLEDYFFVNVLLKVAYLYHDSLETVTNQNNNYDEIEDRRRREEAAGQLYGRRCGELLLEFADNYYTAIEYEFVKVVKSFLAHEAEVFFKLAMVNSLLEEENSKKKAMAIRILTPDFAHYKDPAKLYFRDIFEKLSSTEDREVRFLFKQKFPKSLDFYMNKYLE